MNDTNVSVGNDAPTHHPLDISNFLEEFIPTTTKWIDEDKIPLEDLTSVIYAYYLA